MPRIHPLIALLPSLLLASSSAGADPSRTEIEPAADAWPQWRGPGRDGLSPGRPWPADFSPERLVEIWRVEGLGPSYSGPVVDQERVYTTETVDEEHEVVRALSLATGKELWSTSWEGSMTVPFFASRNGSWIRSTPAVHGDSLFVLGMRDVLKCLDVASGRTRWKVDFVEDLDASLPPFGGVSSPLATDSHVYVQAGGALVKLDRKTGELVWRAMADGGDMMSSGAFSSPIIATLGGRQQVVAQSRTDLAGIDLEDGKTLWSTPVKTFRGMNILTPLVYDDAVFTATYGGRSQLFAVESGEDGLEVEQAWHIGAQGYMTSPVLVDGHAYVFLKSNRFACFDLETGTERWTSPPTGDSYWSLAVRGDRILALSDSGILRLLRADPEEYAVIAERKILDAQTWAHLAPVGDRLFVRAQNALVAFEWR